MSSTRLTCSLPLVSVSTITVSLAVCNINDGIHSNGYCSRESVYVSYIPQMPRIAAMGGCTANGCETGASR